MHVTLLVTSLLSCILLPLFLLLPSPLPSPLPSHFSSLSSSSGRTRRVHRCSVVQGSYQCFKPSGTAQGLPEGHTDTEGRRDAILCTMQVWQMALLFILLLPPFFLSHLLPSFISFSSPLSSLLPLSSSSPLLFLPLFSSSPLPPLSSSSLSTSFPSSLPPSPLPPPSVPLTQLAEGGVSVRVW